MNTQLRSQSGESFWDLSHICWDELTLRAPFGESEIYWVKFQNREWLYRKENALSECVGYQIAQAFGLPLQPWLPFFQSGKKTRDGQPFTVGILVERYPHKSEFRSLERLAGTFPDTAARFLSLVMFDCGSDPSWLANAKGTDLRLIDLENIGPHPVWPICEWRVSGCKRNAQYCFNMALRMAIDAGLRNEFMHLSRQLLELDIAKLVDLSGLPHQGFVGKMASSLRIWQNELRRIHLIKSGLV